MRVAVIGGGPGGMAAATAAKSWGVEDVVLVERRAYLGGVLPQCIHTGFGTQLYGEDYTGCEYAHMWEARTREAGVCVRTGTAVTTLSRSKKWLVDCVGVRRGRELLEADAVIIATGCRERTLPQMLLPGSRPAGIFTAGTAQLMMNIENMLPGRTAVIFGSGDIGLIMARRMTLEGIKVRLILGQEGTGLARNVVQCVEDFQIPLRYGWTLLSTHGYKRLKGVTVAPLGENGQADRRRREYIPCDTLLVATGLIPEMELCRDIPGEATGLYVCGNASGVHDLVDHVTREGVRVGRQAAEDLLGAAVCRAGAKDMEALAEKNIPAEKKNSGGNMVCLECPKGCVMKVTRDPLSVSGNQCERGERFALEEISDPKRVVTAVVSIENSEKLLPVKTDKRIDRGDIFKVMAQVKKIKAPLAVKAGDVVAENIGGTEAALVATGDGSKGQTSS